MTHTDMTSENPDVADAAIRKLITRYGAVLEPLLEQSEPYALVDFPDHNNVGDSAIYAGELVFLDAHVGQPPSYVCSYLNYRRDISAFCPDGPILIHGGGNFGDIWGHHQRIRHDVLEHYRDRQVIQLAQSIHYGDEIERDKTARLIDGHKDFTLLVRDTQSLELAQKHFNCAVHLCPDAAHNMWKLPARPDPEHAVLSVLRLDSEAVDAALRPVLEELGPIDDWLSYPIERDFLGRVLEKFIFPRLPDHKAFMRRRERIYRNQAHALVQHGVDLMETGDLVISDRLHVHILASLMRKQHITLDNFYGKITRYIDTWGEDGLVTRVASDPEALSNAVSQLK